MASESLAAVNTRVVVFTIRAQVLNLLLVKHPREIDPHRWQLPGGAVAPHGDLEQSARLRLMETTGLDGVYLEQLYTFSGSDDGHRTNITVAHVGLVPPPGSASLSSRQASWFQWDELPPVTKSHQCMITMAHERLSAKTEYSTIAYQFLPDEFTLGELQSICEILLRQPIDKRNFRKSVLARKHLEATGRKRMNGAHRPASLYKVKKPGEVEYIK